MSSLSRKVAWLVGGFVGVGTLGCTSLLGTFDAEGAGGGASASGQGGSGMSSAGQGGATVSSSGEGGATASSSGEGGASSSTSSQGGASTSSSGEGGGAVTSTGSSMGCVDCAPNAECINDTCVCKPGFAGTGMTCTDIDECMGNPCGQNASCMNTVGSFTCTCDSGFTSVDGKCEPIWVLHAELDPSLAWNNWSMVGGGGTVLALGGTHATVPMFMTSDTSVTKFASGPLPSSLFNDSKSHPAMVATNGNVVFAFANTAQYREPGGNLWKSMGEWVNVSPVKGEPGAGFGEKMIVLVGGRDKGGGVTPHVLALEIVSLGFLPLPPYLNGPIASPGVAVTNNSVFVVGGTDDMSGSTKLAATLDLGKMTWEPMPDAPFASSRADFVKDDAGRLFYSNGTKVGVFDPGKFAWSNKTFDMPLGMTGGRLVTVGKLVFAVGNFGKVIGVFRLENSPT